MTNLAYNYIAMALMLAEASFFTGKTGISQHLPITEVDVRNGSHVGPPNPKDFGGSILTDHYFFGFGWGHLANFYKRGFMPTTAPGIRQRNMELSKQTSQIDSNGAVRLATNWLAHLGIEIPALESKYKRNVVQWRHYPDGENAQAVLLPVYQVEWRGILLRSRRYESAVATVTIFGATKELVECRVLDDSLFSRPRIQLKEMEKLLAISNDEFGSLPATERSNLVVRFRAGGEQNPAGQTNRQDDAFKKVKKLEAREP